MSLPKPPAPPLRQPTRPALFLLFGSALVALTPHLLRMPPWLGAVTVVFVLWRFVALQRKASPPGLIVRILLAVLMLGLVLTQYQTIFGRTAGSALLITFTGLKVLETRNLRDAMFCNALLMIVVLANFLFIQSPATAVYGVACLILVVGNFSMLIAPRGFSAIRAIRLTAIILLNGIPLALAAYILFPRIEGSIWGIAEDPYSAVSGLSDTVSPGDVNRLSLNDNIAFRVDFDGTVPDQHQLYWRTLVLDRFDGHIWSRSESGAYQGKTPQAPGSQQYRYTIALEANNKPWIPVLETPLAIESDYTMSELGTVRAHKRIRTRTTYSGTSATSAHIKTPGDVNRNLQLYGYMDDKIHTLAEDFRSGANDTETIASRALDMFRNEDFYYTLTPPILHSEPVADFLFETRRGYCEHYASAFATLMRAAGVPARLVIGYQGGELNQAGRYYIVRQSDAHAWTEIWIDGKGWVRVDPTAAIAPERIELGMDALRRIDDAGGLNTSLSAARLRALLQPNWFNASWKKLGLWSDAFTHQWNKWITAYGPEQQRDLLRRLGFKAPDWGWMVLTLTIVAIGFILITHLVLNRSVKKAETPLKYFHTFKRRLEKAGIQTLPGEAAQTYVQRAAIALPEQAQTISTIGNLYAALRYGRNKNQDLFQDFRQMVTSFKPTRSTVSPESTLV